jgi:hypothetical protein
MAGSKFHHRIPIIGRSFLQRNEARLQRDEALRELARLGAEKDEARRERDEARQERDKARRARDEAVAPGRGQRVDNSEETRTSQTAAKAQLAEEAEEETRTFQEESYRNLEFLSAPAGVAAGESIDDAEIIRRVVRAYKSDRLLGSKPTAIWEFIYNTRQAPLHEILSGEHLTAIENLLRRPGDSNLFYGFDNLFIDRVRRLKQLDKAQADAYLAKHAKRQLDKLLHCAEIMGALRCENPESGAHKYGSIPLESLLEAIDQRLGVKLRFPNPFPDEFGLMSARGVIGVRAVHAIYQAWRIRELVRGIPNPRVVEIGGGLGRTAFYSLLLGVQDYTIIDLPFTAVAQGYFLMRTLGSESVILHGESGAPGSKIKLLQPSGFFEGADTVDLVVNVDSMTELDRETADRYWRQIKRRSAKFLSINHESNPFTIKEIAEADAVGVAGSQRYPYALRKGYVEELFTFS